MRLIYVSSFAIVAAGCAAKNTSSGTIGQADSQQVGSSLAAGIEQGAQGYGPQSSGTAFDAACITLSGNTADTDQDSIPAAATLTFACTDTRLGYTGTLTGTEMVTDSQPTAIAWAFSATADLHSSLTGPGGASIVNTRSGTIVGTQASAVGPFSLARTLDVTTVFTAATGAAVTVAETNDWTLTYTPTATWTAGSLVVGGTLTATGTWDVVVGANAASATLATPTPLTMTPTCATRVTAGVVTGTYQAGARTSTITVTWTGCGQSTVTYAEH
jgi:hypothetical protein